MKENCKKTTKEKQLLWLGNYYDLYKYHEVFNNQIDLKKIIVWLKRVNN